MRDVVTGASSGIGKAAAHAIAKKVARLVLAVRREQPLQVTADECRWHDAEVRVVRTDVTD